MSDDNFENMPDMTTSTGSTFDAGVMPVPREDGSMTPCVQVGELRSAHIVVPGQDPVVAVFSLASDAGVYVLLPPNAARAFATALLRSALAAEQGYGVRKQ